MPKSVASLDGDDRREENEDDDQDDVPHNPADVSSGLPRLKSIRSGRGSAADLRSRLPSRIAVDESTGLLTARDGTRTAFHSVSQSIAGTPSARLSRQNSASARMPRHHGRAGSFGLMLANALGVERRMTMSGSLEGSSSSLRPNDRVWYDQFTSTDWVHDSIADAIRIKALRSRKDIRGRVLAVLDGAQGWVLVAITGCVTACIAFIIDVTEDVIFDFKSGYCSTGWLRSRTTCCEGTAECKEWNTWSEVIQMSSVDNTWIDFGTFTLWIMTLAVLSCLLTLTTKTVVPSTVSLSTLDENLGAQGTEYGMEGEGRKRSSGPSARHAESQARPPMVYYSAAGSGVAEVKVILSGFVLHGYLGARTLVVKTLALILSISSGLSLGKEGPYVHISTCVGNIACRLFDKYRHNDAKRREVLSASSAAGVAVAFGAPIGGVLFSLEEVSYYFPSKTLFRTFFCCIVAALSLKFLNPYGTEKIVLFQVRYLSDWKTFEMLAFVFTGILGGALGACFIKASRIWATTFRRIPIIKQHPVLEVALVALITGLVSYWNRYTKMPVAELLYELAKPCDIFIESNTTLCPTKDQTLGVVWYLFLAFVIKAVLTTITFGIKVPAGIYVPSMVVGGLMGRMVGHIVQYWALTHPGSAWLGSCAADANPESCVTPGVYAMVAAGATMCGVTRLSVTLAVILFELTGSLDHVLPFSAAILAAKWTADFIEPLSIYDLLLDMNAYPFLDNKIKPIFHGSDLSDIVPRTRTRRIIDISSCPLVPARVLRRKLDHIHMAGELDGGLPILRDGILVGLIPAPDLEFALDKLENEDETLCLMAPSNCHDRRSSTTTTDDHHHHHRRDGGRDSPALLETQTTQAAASETDFTPFIDPAPVALDVHSPIDLIYECFVKLGLRYICVLSDGKFTGMIHRKQFVKFVKELEGNGRAGHR